MVQTLVVLDPLADLARLEGVPSAVVAARDAVDAVYRDRGRRVVTADQSAQALLAGARASAALTGTPEGWLAGSVRLSTELAALSALIRVSPGQAIARAHVLVAHGRVPAADLGRIRPSAGIGKRILGLNRLLTEPTSASVLVLAAVAHAEVVSVAPFGTADGIIARAVEHMVLISGGIDPGAVIVPEAGHLALAASYHTALVGYQDGTAAAVRDWLLHCTRALTRGAEVSPVISHRRE
jgi:hypothetical protein